MIVPRPLSGCQIKAEIKGFLLRYCLFQYKHWFFPNFDLNHFPDSAFTPCRCLASLFYIVPLLPVVCCCFLACLGTLDKVLSVCDTYLRFNRNTIVYKCDF